MVRWIFDNEYIKRNYEDKLKNIWRQVITKPTPDLTILVFYPKDKHYEYLMKHWEGYRLKREMNHATIVLHYPIEEIVLSRAYEQNGYGHGRCCYGYFNQRIKLYLSESTSDYWIAWLMAHEYRHWMQFKRYGDGMRHRDENGRLHRPIQIEKDANDWASERMKHIGYKR